jgi:secondary thiamine-phosphate synthase enzyme
MRGGVRALHGAIEVQTRGRGMYLFTQDAAQWLGRIEAQAGLLTAFIQHTSASLLIQENADTDVQADLERFFAKLVTDGDPMFAHDAEGPDDMPSHVRAALTQTHLGIPVLDGRMALGTWQGLFLYEHRTSPHQRRIVLSYLGT